MLMLLLLYVRSVCIDVNIALCVCAHELVCGATVYELSKCVFEREISIRCFLLTIVKLWFLA